LFERKKTRERSSALAFYAFVGKKNHERERERERSSEGELDRISNLSVV